MVQLSFFISLWNLRLHLVLAWSNHGMYSLREMSQYCILQCKYLNFRHWLYFTITGLWERNKTINISLKKVRVRLRISICSIPLQFWHICVNGLRSELSPIDLPKMWRTLLADVHIKNICYTDWIRKKNCLWTYLQGVSNLRWQCLTKLSLDSLT